MSKRSIDARVLSIGTLPANPFWGEKAGVQPGSRAARTGHATSTLIRAGERTIVVDPGLPDPVIVARLHERAGISPEDVTHVFFTSFQPDTSRGATAFEHATWWISPVEREGVGVPLVQELKLVAARGHDELVGELERQVAVLKRCEPAPDRLAEGVDLFPLHGVTPGLTGLLVALPHATVLVAGDAVPTVEHLERGQVLTQVNDVEKARESFAEALEIADWIICGRDNLVVNPVKRAF